MKMEKKYCFTRKANSEVQKPTNKKESEYLKGHPK